jgi:hypothetical protein
MRPYQTTNLIPQIIFSPNNFPLSTMFPISWATSPYQSVTTILYSQDPQSEVFAILCLLFMVADSLLTSPISGHRLWAVHRPLVHIKTNTEHMVVTVCVPIVLTYLWPVPPRGPHLMRPSTHQFMDGHHYLCKLGTGYAAITVYVIQFKCPAQFLIDRTT